MSKLKFMADTMMAEAYKKRKVFAAHDLDPGGIVEKPLGGGVRLRLMASDFQFSLLVIRQKVSPSELEMKVFRNVFEVVHPTETSGHSPKHGFYCWLVWDIPRRFTIAQTLPENPTRRAMPHAEQITEEV